MSYREPNDKRIEQIRKWLDEDFGLLEPGDVRYLLEENDRLRDMVGYLTTARANDLVKIAKLTEPK